MHCVRLRGMEEESRDQARREEPPIENQPGMGVLLYII